MTADRTLSPKQSELYHLAESLHVGRMYSDRTRNSDDAVIDKYNHDKKIRGTEAWAIEMAMCLPNALRDDPRFTDAKCQQIINILQEIKQ